MASSYDGDVTALVPADEVDLDGWSLVAILDSGEVVDECPWEREAWATYTRPLITAWTAFAEFNDPRPWGYGLRSPDGEVFRLLNQPR